MILSMMHLCGKTRLKSMRIGGWCLRRGQRVGGVVIGSCSVSASGFRSRALSSSSGAGSSCSCKAPVLRQTMKGVWKLSITRLLSRPHPWECFPVSLLLAWPLLVYLPIYPAVWPCGMPPKLLLYILIPSFILFSPVGKKSRLKVDPALPLHPILSSKKFPKSHGSKPFPSF